MSFAGAQLGPSPFVSAISEWVQKKGLGSHAVGVAVASTKSITPLDEQRPVTEYIPDAASILYWPGKFHTELAVGEQIYNPFIDYRSRNTLREARESANKEGKTGFIRFGITLTAEEAARLEAYLIERKGTSSYKTCVDATSEAIRATTGMLIPFPFNSHPTINAAYLSALYFTKISRVTSMEVNGHLTPHYVDILSAAALAGVLGSEILMAHTDPSTLLRILSYNWLRVITHTTGKSCEISAMGPCFISPPGNASL